MLAGCGSLRIDNRDEIESSFWTMCVNIRNSCGGQDPFARAYALAYNAMDGSTRTGIRLAATTIKLSLIRQRFGLWAHWSGGVSRSHEVLNVTG
jgi:hypothetical protein